MASPATLNEAPNLEAIKQRQQQTWASGDYAVIGRTLVIVSEQLCESIDLRAGSEVLDVATGHGITALAAARRWGRVTGVDYVPSLLDRARERAAAERLEVDFREGDAESLPFADGSFDSEDRMDARRRYELGTTRERSNRYASAAS